MSALLLAAALAAPVAAAAPDVPAGYALVWSDEFDRAGHPDPTKWVHDTHANKGGWYNNELQYYAPPRLENARVEDGRLIITARREQLSSAPDHGGQAYSSARLITQGKASWIYGFYEIRAKLPCGAGSWPAIWMLGDGRPWPMGGEIDIMEHVGNAPGIVSSTVHTKASEGTSGNGGNITLPTACNAFHRYQLEWTPNNLRFAVDGRPVHRYARKGNSPAQWPFDRPQFLLLNLAVGGEMAGRVTDAALPFVFEIDYVRVYQQKTGNRSTRRSSAR